MRKIFIYLIVIFWFQNYYSDNLPQEIINQLKQAETYYKQKKYIESIKAYEEVVHNDYQSFELYYNLANAYYKNNQLGKAILYYEKAKQLNPSDEDVKHNLKIAYAKTIDKIETKDNFFIEVTKTNFLSQINVNTLAYLTIILSLLAFVAFALFLFVIAYRKLFLTLTILFSISTGIIYLIGKSALSTHQKNNFAVVVMKEIKVSNEPLPNAITKFNLHEGTKVKILQKVDNFFLIRLENGVEGWIDEKSVELI